MNPDPLETLRIAAEDARSLLDRAKDLRYASMLHGEPAEDLTELQDEAEATELAYLAALGCPEPACAMTTSNAEYRRMK